MLIEFTVANYLSIKGPVTLSLYAADLERLPDNTLTLEAEEPFRLLKSSAIYGANASGKSNVIKALAFLQRFALSSHRLQVTDPIDITPFRLSTETEHKPSELEVLFVLEGIRHRYRLSVDQEKVWTEELWHAPGGREVRLFERDGAHIRVNKKQFREGIGLEERTRPNALFLSLVAQFNGPIASNILYWFKRLEISSGLDDAAFLRRTIKDLDNPIRKAQILKMIQTADLSIEDIVLESLLGVLTVHPKFDEARQRRDSVLFELEAESQGTRKFFALSGQLLRTIEEGGILVIDELDARFHPLLSRTLVQLFNSAENRRGAQLICATHDVRLLDRRLFRPDQIWFTEKDPYGATALYSLVEFDLSEDAVYARDYIQGKYGAIPILGSFDWVTEPEAKPSNGPGPAQERDLEDA